MAHRAHEVAGLSEPSRPRDWRLFIAHPVPPEVRSRLERQLAPYRRAYPNVRWTRPQTWHLTLLFLGPVSPARVPELQQLTDTAAAHIPPYRVSLDQGGGRARQGEGVAWLAASQGAKALIEAAALLAQHCPPDITGGPPPRRTPSAHLTLARKVERGVIDVLRVQALGPLGVDWEVGRIQLVRSLLDPAGARYETLHGVTL